MGQEDILLAVAEIVKDYEIKSVYSEQRRTGEEATLDNFEIG